MSESTDPVLVHQSGAVATVVLNRPAALNSLTEQTKDALLAALRDVAAEDGIRAVVLTGAGRGFCVGQDLKEHASALTAGRPLAATISEHFNPIATLLATMPKPVVAAVNGTAAGAGASFAFACDLRLAAESASFLLAFARVGLSADSGASWTLPRLVGYGRATALLMLAEPVSAQQALEMGLVSAVVADDALDAAAQELAGRLAAGPTAAYAAIKKALAFSTSHDLQASLEHEAELQDAVGTTSDHRDATAAFVAKQPAVFTGR